MDYLQQHKCIRCSHCCRVAFGIWQEAELADEQIELLQSERSKHPKGVLRNCNGYKGPCDMFVEPNICLIRELLGYEFTPERCKNYGCKKTHF